MSALGDLMRASRNRVPVDAVSLSGVPDKPNQPSAKPEQAAGERLASQNPVPAPDIKSLNLVGSIKEHGERQESGVSPSPHNNALVPAGKYDWSWVLSPKIPPVIHLPSIVAQLLESYEYLYDSECHLPEEFVSHLYYDHNGDYDATLIAMQDAEIRLRGTPDEQAEWQKIQEYEDAIRSMNLEAVGPAPAEAQPVNNEESEFDESRDSQAEAINFQFETLDSDIQFALDSSQEQAIRLLAPQRHGCLIGAAGTGKTTTTKVLVSTLMFGNREWNIEPLRLTSVNVQKYHERVKEANKKRGKESPDVDVKGTIIPSIAMVAYTGQATQVLKRNLPASWARNVMTIHLLLGYAPVSYLDVAGKEKFRFEPTYTKYNRMPWDVIVIDETSMVAVDLWHKLLEASKPGCRFYFIGDLNQLPPPIGTGILGFALSKWPVAELTTVHRQKDDAANRIVDTAHRILRGDLPEFDINQRITKPKADSSTVPVNPVKSNEWRVGGYEISTKADDAHVQICKAALIFSKILVDPENPDKGPLYNPFRDRIMVPMNGKNPQSADFPIGQLDLNDELAGIFADKGEERVIIDAKRMTKRFARGYRVMATKNESPAMEDRVTNGLTGRIIHIEENPEWAGDRMLVGLESVVKENKKKLIQNMHDRQVRDQAAGLESFSFTSNHATPKAPDEERQGGPASHVITIQFDNGAVRTYRQNAQIESIYLAYASTVHKAQGAEMPMAIVVIHHLHRKMLCRELLYTAVTRASQRVLIMYTDFGMQLALRTQRISGKNLAEKIVQYQNMMSDLGGFNLRGMEVRLEITGDEVLADWVEGEDSEDIDDGE